MARRLRISSIGFLVVLGRALGGTLCGIGSLAAQEAEVPPPIQKTAAQKTGDRKVRRVWIQLERYDERTSRAAFAACDTDRDDRLDVREAIVALPNMGTFGKPLGFRALDANRNGFVHWDEFDGRYRGLTNAGASFLFRPTRTFRPRPASKKATASEKGAAAIARLMKMVGDDADPDVSKSEFLKLLATLKQPGSLANTFPLLDKDQSGGLSAAELAPVAAKAPYLLELTKIDPNAVVEPTVREKDLRKQLRRVHPSLARWTEQIFRAADSDADGKLSRQEIDPTAK
jgi:Ca2+-binding EF-hand superfamily protein